MKFIKLLNKVIFNASISFEEAIIYVFSHNFLRFLSLLHTYQRCKGRAWSHRVKNKISYPRLRCHVGIAQ